MFNELNSVENYIRDLLSGAPRPGQIADETAPYLSAGRSGKGTGWHYVPALSLSHYINEVHVSGIGYAPVAHLSCKRKF
jgi:hypothetical protein